MQISASNLLVAAQQPRSPSSAQQLHSGFAQAMSANKDTASFEPMNFKTSATSSLATGEAGRSEASAQAKPYTPAQAPGAQLDIRI